MFNNLPGQLSTTPCSPLITPSAVTYSYTKGNVQGDSTPPDLHATQRLERYWGRDDRNSGCSEIEKPQRQTPRSSLSAPLPNRFVARPRIRIFCTCCCGVVGRLLGASNDSGEVRVLTRQSVSSLPTTKREGPKRILSVQSWPLDRRDRFNI